MSEEKVFDLHMVFVEAKNGDGVVFNPYNPQPDEFEKGKEVEIWIDDFDRNEYIKGIITQSYNEEGNGCIKVEEIE